MDDRQVFETKCRRDARGMLARGGLYPTRQALKTRGRAQDRVANTLEIIRMVPQLDPGDLFAVVVLLSLLT